MIWYKYGMTKNGIYLSNFREEIPTMELMLETHKSKLFKSISGYVRILKEGDLCLKIHYDPLCVRDDNIKSLDIVVVYSSEDARDTMFNKIDEVKVLAIMSAIS